MTHSELGIIVTLYLGAITVFKWLSVSKNDVVSKEDFDKHLQEYSHHKGAVTKEEFAEHIIDFKERGKHVQYTDTCKAIRTSIEQKIDSNREILEKEIKSAVDIICTKIEAVNGKKN